MKHSERYRLPLLFLIQTSTLCLDATQVVVSPALEENLNTPSFTFQEDLTPHAGWYAASGMFNSSSTPVPFNGRVYFLIGSSANISSATTSAALPFASSSAALIANNVPDTAWYADTGTFGATIGFSGNIYYLTANSSSVSYASTTLSANSSSTALTLNATSNTAWYSDSGSFFGSSPLNGNVYYLSYAGGVISSVAHSCSFQSTLAGFVAAAPDAAWYYDASSVGGIASLYHLSYSGGAINAASQNFTMSNNSDTVFAADAAANVAWFGEQGSSGTLYYLNYSGGAINSSSTSVHFNGTSALLTATGGPDSVWYSDSYIGLAPYDAKVYYCTGSVGGISEQSAVLSFTTASLNFSAGKTANTAWFYDNYGVSGFTGNVYYLIGSDSGIQNSVGSYSFQTAGAILLADLGSNEAWYFDSETFSGASVANVHYLIGSNTGIASSSATLSFTSSEALLSPAGVAGAAWYYDVGQTGSAFDGTIYYLEGSVSGIASASASSLHFLTPAASLLADPSSTSAWYYDHNYNGSTTSGNVYYVSATPSSPNVTVYGWTAGSGGALMNSVFNSSIVEMKALQNQIKRPVSNISLRTANAVHFTSEPEDFLADASDKLHVGSKAQSSESKSYLLQFIPFYDFIHQSKQGVVPAFSNNLVGGLATFDAKIREFVIGGGVAYAYNHTHLNQGLGHAITNQEVGVLYGSWEKGRVFLNLTCWGGFYQIKGDRAFAGALTSRYSTHGYTITPHAEIQIKTRPLGNWFSLDVFARTDWVNVFQNGYTEYSPSEAQLRVPHEYASMLRSEGGLYFQETFFLNRGRLLLLQKASYINQVPFQNNVLSALFSGSSSLFSIASGSIATQNLGALELQCTFYPNACKIPYVGIDFQGEFGSKLQSYFAAVKLGRDF